MKPKLRRYTVLLSYPEYIDNGGETYLAWVKARSVDEAVSKAQMEACASIETLDEKDREDFFPQFVTTGWKRDLYTSKRR